VKDQRPSESQRAIDAKAVGLAVLVNEDHVDWEDHRSIAEKLGAHLETSVGMKRAEEHHAVDGNYRDVERWFPTPFEDGLENIR
jgi:hypothetical protein